jgi:hypothetical protein
MLLAHRVEHCVVQSQSALAAEPLIERVLEHQAWRRARALLEGLFEREQWHYGEYRSFMLAQRAMALAQGEQQAVRALEETLLDIERRFGA